MSLEKVRDAATPGQDDKPAKKTTIGYRDALERLFILGPRPAWQPSRGHTSAGRAAPSTASPTPGPRVTGGAPADQGWTA
jgi:hypothetical protein